MKRTTIALLAGFWATAIGAAPALADQLQLSTILFGKIYNDNVTTHQLGMSRHNDETGMPSFVLYPSKARVSAAQAEAAQDASLREALARRDIAIKNVIWVQTALNGGKVVYYR